MYKHILRAAVALALAAGSAAAVADIPQKELQVKGTIRTPICTVATPDDGIYDYERINMSNIPSTGHLALSALAKRWTVDCGEGSTFLGFQITDNRESTSSFPSSVHFGLGSVDGYEGSKIGYYTVTLSDATIGGDPAFTLKGTKGAATGVGSATTQLDRTLSHSWTDGTGTRGPTAGSNFGVTMTVQGNINNKTDMKAEISAGVPLDGHLTLTYSFGL